MAKFSDRWKQEWGMFSKRCKTSDSRFMKKSYYIYLNVSVIP